MELYIYIYIVIYEGLYFDLAQGQMNGAPNETRTHSCRFAPSARTSHASTIRLLILLSE